jgi:cyclophilin family peptidyl-prolyl cis-trans isomerase
MKVILLFVLSFSISVFAQFTRNDRQLAATTFTRNFDKITTTEYLKSDKDDSVIAGLLSVSQSEDTNYVPLILKLPPDKFAREICFTLGQLGSCWQSAEYLRNLFYQEENDPLTRYYALTALGKTADSTIAVKLMSDYSTAESKSAFNGISLALYYLSVDGIIPADKIRPVLENEMYLSASRQFEAAFCLYRIGPSKTEKEFLVKTLSRYLNAHLINSVSEKPVSYILACLRKLQYFPDDFGLIRKLSTFNDLQTRVETARTSVYYNFRTVEEVDFFLNYLKDDNQNISFETASAIKNMMLSSDLKKYLEQKLEQTLQSDTRLDNYTRGELFISFLSISPGDFNDVSTKYFNDKIASEYLYRACSLYTGSKEALNFLIQKYPAVSATEKVSILESLLGFDQILPEVSSIMLGAIDSDEPVLLSVAAEGADSSFIQAMKDTLTEVILNQSEKHLNDPRFAEALMALESISEKISPSLKDTILALLSGSDLYSINKYAASIKGESIRTISKDIDDFDIYWNKAFEFRQAEIVTEKGSFTISFFPGYAPVTVGSFCYLAEKHFFDATIFHRVVPGFVIQGGDPTGTGWGGPGYEIVSEFSPLEYNKGMVGMASSGKDTEGSQWFVTTGNYPHLNGKYTIFAEVLEGMDVVDKITPGTRITGINLTR